MLEISSVSRYVDKAAEATGGMVRKAVKGVFYAHVVYKEEGLEVIQKNGVSAVSRVGGEGARMVKGAVRKGQEFVLTTRESIEQDRFIDWMAAYISKSESLTEKILKAYYAKLEYEESKPKIPTASRHFAEVLNRMARRSRAVGPYHIDDLFAVVNVLTNPRLDRFTRLTEGTGAALPFIPVDAVTDLADYLLFALGYRLEPDKNKDLADSNVVLLGGNGKRKISGRRFA